MMFPVPVAKAAAPRSAVAEPPPPPLDAEPELCPEEFVDKVRQISSRFDRSSCTPTGGASVAIIWIGWDWSFVLWTAAAANSWDCDCNEIATEASHTMARARNRLSSSGGIHLLGMRIPYKYTQTEGSRPGFRNWPPLVRRISTGDKAGT